VGVTGNDVTNRLRPWDCVLQLIRDAYRVTNQQRMAARRALEWIRASKAWLAFRYEVSDLFSRLSVLSATRYSNLLYYAVLLPSMWQKLRGATSRSIVC